jgi:hypothetical protein
VDWPFLEQSPFADLHPGDFLRVLLGLLGLFQLEKEARRGYVLSLQLQRDHRQLQQGFRYCSNYPVRMASPACTTGAISTSSANGMGSTAAAEVGHCPAVFRCRLFQEIQ